MSSIVIAGDTSGSVTLQAPAVAGTTTLNLPSTTGTIALTSGLPSAATPTALGTVYGKQTSVGGSPYLTAYGYNAGLNTTGVGVTALGAEAAKTNSTGSGMTAVGYAALYSNTTGEYNSAHGYLSLYTNTTGQQSNAFGFYALHLNTTGSHNNAYGSNALYANTTGEFNTSFGSYALAANTTASYNTALGYTALTANTTTSYNTALGYSAGTANTTGGVTAVGAGALAANTTGYANTALGGYDNLVTVQAALRYNTTGYRNVAVGTGALTTNTTGINCVAVGYQAGFGQTTASGIGQNTFIGYNAASNLTDGYSGIYIGGSCAAGSVSASNEIVIGQNATGKGTQTGFIQPNGGGVYQGNNTTTWTTTSDRRLKKNIVDNNDGLDKINAIQVRNFEYRVEEEITELPKDQVIKKQGVQLGVIAQELQTILPDCIKTEATGVMSVNADNLTWYLINAVKEQQALITTLTERITALEGA